MIDRRAKFLILVAALVVSIASARSLPVLPIWGGDLHNLVVYQRCARDVSPYLVSGTTCGDAWGRSLLYPPLLYHSYVWTRPFRQFTAITLWTTFQILGFGAMLFAFGRRLVLRDRPSGSAETTVFSGLLLLQFPALFALERGGSDILALLAITIAGVLLLKRRSFAAGLCLGLATAYKLYPLFCCAVITLGLLLSAWSASSGTGPILRLRRMRKDWLRFGVGAALAFGLVFVLYWTDSRLYFFKVLPEFSKLTTPADVNAHSLISLTGRGNLGVAYAVFAAIAAVWVWAGARSFSKGEVAVPVAGALALSTYLQGVSWDYNLVTTYPLLLLCFMRAQDTNRWGVLALGVVALLGDRAWFVGAASPLLNPTTHVMLQVAFLITSALAFATDSESRPRAASLREATLPLQG